MATISTKAALARKYALTIENFHLSDTLPRDLRDFVDAMDCGFMDLQQLVSEGCEDSSRYKEPVEYINGWLKWNATASSVAKGMHNQASKKGKATNETGDDDAPHS